MIITSLLQSYDQIGYNDASTTCVTDKYGNKHWYLNGRRHRTDGPAIELVTGAKEWWVNGMLHRIEYVDGSEIQFTAVPY